MVDISLVVICLTVLIWSLENREQKIRIWHGGVHRACCSESKPREYSGYAFAEYPRGGPVVK